MSDTDARAEIARPRHVARFSSGAYCVVAPIPAREAKYFRVKYQTGLSRFTSRFRPARLLFASRAAILMAAGHDVGRTVTGLTTTRTEDASNG